MWSQADASTKLPYGWDSYFIVRGLLRARRIELARGIVDNFLFEVENYGAMLNANRTYYLSRSQPPFLSSMFVDVYDALRKSGQEDPAWLARAYTDLQKDYECGIAIRIAQVIPVCRAITTSVKVRRPRR